MRCPMAFGRGEEEYNDECYKEDCAWWLADYACCAVLQLSIDLYQISNCLQFDTINVIER